MNNTSQANTYRLFGLFGLFWVLLGWLGIALATLGIFYREILLVYLIGGFIIWLRYVIKINTRRISRDVLWVTIISFIFIIFLANFTTPTVFSGRDQGSFSQSAIRLATDHKMTSLSTVSQEFFKIYGSGVAFNFPGFNYNQTGELTTHLSLGYVSWLAIFYSLWGIKGFIIANSITFFLFLVSFYLLLRLFLNPAQSFIGYSLILTSFVFSWFFKFTLSENIALGLLWFSILYFILFLRNSEKFYALAFLSPIFLLIFTRLETLAFIAIMGIILLLKHRQHQLNLKKFLDRKWIIPGIILLVLYILVLKVNYPFYRSSLKGLVNSFINPGEAPVNKDSLFSIIYVFKVLSVYTLLHFLLISLVSVVYFIRQKRWEILIPLWIVLPTFIYLVHPGISPDHPWMLRRFTFSIAPVIIMLAVSLMADFFKRKIYFYTLSVLLLITNLAILSPYFTFSENKDLLPQIEKISQSFSDNDLVLVDREATGDGWAMMSDPMNTVFHKQAVYFFNLNDLTKLNLDEFDHVYFIIPDGKLDFYNSLLSRLTQIKDYRIETESLAITSGTISEVAHNDVELPQKDRRIIYGKIYLFK